MQVYKMKMILGKESQYKKDGTLKNQVIQPLFHGEKEIADLLTDERWKSLGVCEIECVDVFDSKTQVRDEHRIAEINKVIYDLANRNKKPLSELELLKQQNALLSQALETMKQAIPKAQEIVKVQEQEQIEPDFKDEEVQEQTSDEQSDKFWKLQYKEKFGKMPHSKMKIETIKNKVNEQ